METAKKKTRLYHIPRKVFGKNPSSYHPQLLQSFFSKTFPIFRATVVKFPPKFPPKTRFETVPRQCLGLGLRFHVHFSHAALCGAAQLWDLDDLLHDLHLVWVTYAVSDEDDDANATCMKIFQQVLVLFVEALSVAFILWKEMLGSSWLAPTWHRVDFFLYFLKPLKASINKESYRRAGQISFSRH